MRVIGILLFSCVVLFLCAGCAAEKQPAGESESVPQAVVSETEAPEISGTASSADDEDEDLKLREQGSIGRIDYPFIDIYFEKDKIYRVVLCRYMMADEIVKEYKDKGDFFNQNKKDFSIITIPAGLGTTPDYSLALYEGKKCIKAIDCVGVRPGVLDGKW